MLDDECSGRLEQSVGSEPSTVQAGSSLLLPRGVCWWAIIADDDELDSINRIVHGPRGRDRRRFLINGPAPPGRTGSAFVRRLCLRSYDAGRVRGARGGGGGERIPIE